MKKILLACLPIVIIVLLGFFVFPEKQQEVIAAPPLVEAPAPIVTFPTPAPEPVFVPVVDNTGGNTSEGAPLKF